MGMFMSFMGKGLPVPTTQMTSYVMGTLNKQFVDKNIKTFDEFHGAIIDVFNTFNSALPGKHYDVPSRNEVEACFKSWKEASEWSEKEKIFTDFLKKNVNPGKLDNTTLIIGIATPPAAMAAKRAGENVPQLGFIKAIPDVLFVPSATILALVSAKLTKRMVQGSTVGS